MSAPRPPGVRCAFFGIERLVLQLTACPRKGLKIPWAFRFRYARISLAPLQPHCPRQRNRKNPKRGLALSARATSQAGDRYVQLPATKKSAPIHGRQQCWKKEGRVGI